MKELFEESAVGSVESSVYAQVVDRLNLIFNEKWDRNNIDGALHGVELIVNTMASELTDGNDSVQLRMAALDMSSRLLTQVNPSAASLVSNAKVIEEYVRSSSSKP